MGPTLRERKISYRVQRRYARRFLVLDSACCPTRPKDASSDGPHALKDAASFQFSKTSW